MVSFVKIRMETCPLELEACRPWPCAEPLLRSGGRLEWEIVRQTLILSKSLPVEGGVKDEIRLVRKS